MTLRHWTDVSADLETAISAAQRAAAKAAGLPALDGEAREDRELAIGKLVHDACSAAEKALERLVELVDGELPKGSSFHRDLIRRAAGPVQGGRDAMITPETANALARLVAFRHVFRHIYGGFEYERAASMVPLAAATIPRLRDELTAFAAAIGLAPRA